MYYCCKILWGMGKGVKEFIVVIIKMIFFKVIYNMFLC